MKPLPATLLAATLVAAAFSAYAASPAAAASAAARGPVADCPMGGASGTPGCGPANGARRGAMQPRWGQGMTPGWAMMSAQERDEHRRQMGSFTTYEACTAYRDQHHAQMTARAKERKMPVPGTPRHDPCAGLPKAG